MLIKVPIFPDDVLGWFLLCLHHILPGLGLGTANAPVCLDTPPEQPSGPGFEGLNYNMVRGLECIDGPSKDMVWLVVQELS
jgi:hypothetical protein